MNMQDAIERLGAISLRLRRRTPFTAPPGLVETNRMLERAFVAGAQPPTPESLSALASRIVESVHAGRSQDISRRDWRQAAWCLWLTEQPLAHDAAVLDAYLGWLRREGRISAYKRLVSAYLRDFNEEDATIADVANVLTGIAAKFDWPWREKHKQFHLFSVERGPQTVAEAVIASEHPIRESLDGIGLMGDFFYQGFGVESFKIALALYRAEPTERLLGRILEWSCLDNTFQFGAIRHVIANSLLLPWSDTDRRNNLSSEMADTSRDFLLKHYQDPRLKPGLWNGVNQDARSIMLRWLAKASLEQFLQVVDDIASPQLKTQWPYRRAFWEAYDRIGVIEEAWVAFTYYGAQHACGIFDGKLKFGTLDSSGVQHNHAVLILKLTGGLTIAEWSENGKCHVWLSSNEVAPNLYQPQPYSRRQLTANSDNGGVVHAASKHGTWQRKVADFIRDNTGVRLNQSDYMPIGAH